MFWFRGSVAEAINKSKNDKKVFIVFINGNDVISQKMNEMYESLSSELSNMPLVAVKLEAQSDNCKLFSQIYPVILIPCTYFIDFNGVAIEIIGGSLDNEKDLMERINKVIKIYNKSLSEAPQQQSPAESPSTSLSSPQTPVESVANNQPKQETSASSSPVTNPQTIESKVERANQLIEAIREKKAKEEEERAKKEEIERRQGLKEMQKAKRLREEKEVQEVISEREREKREERIARERVLAQIAADREERKARQSVLNSAEKQSSQQEPLEPTPGSSTSSSSSSVRQRVYDRARIQFRLPDGSTKTEEFGANDTLETVRQYLFSNFSFRDFILSTTFPRREFTSNDYNQTLQQLSLSPTSVLLVIPNKGTNSSKEVTSPSVFWQLFTFIFSPFIMIWGFISRLFSSSDTTDSTDELIASLRRNLKKKPKKFYSREGNVARIRDPMKDDSDNENNTWNGNSTQQM